MRLATQTSRRTILKNALGTAGTLAVTGRLPASASPFAEDFPRYHFRPAKNWINDPNGLIYWNHEYHLFYQYNPNAPYWGDMHWGHGVSPDLVHWKHLPVAMSPDQKGVDQDGVFSGMALVNKGVPTLIYTGTLPETQCLATTHDNFRTIQKLPSNPVIKGWPDGMELTGFRDPWVWKEEGKNDGVWLMALGAGRKNARPLILLYESNDLMHWKYLHPLMEAPEDGMGKVFECPNFFPLGDRWVLLTSLDGVGKVLGFAGRYQDRRFVPEQHSVIDPGGSLYAPQTMLDADGRRVMFGWLRENRSKEADIAAGWSGVQSVPRVLTMLPDGSIGYAPHPNVAKLRGKHTRVTAKAVTPGKPIELPSGTALDIHAVLDPSKTPRVGFELRASPDRREHTWIYYDSADGYLMVERIASSLSDQAKGDNLSFPLKLKAGEKLDLRILLDASVIETFVNGRLAVTSRIYPTLHASVLNRLMTQDGDSGIVGLDIWEMSSAYE